MTDADFQALAAHTSGLEARLTLCEAAIAALLAALARSSNSEAALAHNAMKLISNDVLQNMAASSDLAADARAAQTANTFIDLSKPKR